MASISLHGLNAPLQEVVSCGAITPFPHLHNSDLNVSYKNIRFHSNTHQKTNGDQVVGCTLESERKETAMLDVDCCRASDLIKRKGFGQIIQFF